MLFYGHGLHNLFPLRGIKSVGWHLLHLIFFRLNTLKGTTIPLTEVILDFRTLRDTKPRILTPKSTTITLVTFIWECLPPPPPHPRCEKGKYLIEDQSRDRPLMHYIHFKNYAKNTCSNHAWIIECVQSKNYMCIIEYGLVGC